MDFLEKRIEKRVRVQLRADACPLDPGQQQGILDGQGFSDLFSPSFGHRHPRDGRDRISTSDLSFSGLRLQGNFAFEEGMKLLVDLHLPGERVLVKVLLEVVWCRKAEGDGGYYFAGARFVALEEQNSRRIADFVGDVTQVE